MVPLRCVYDARDYSRRKRFFFEKRTKKLLFVRTPDVAAPSVQIKKVFLLPLLEKKKCFPSLLGYFLLHL